MAEIATENIDTTDLHVGEDILLGQNKFDYIVESVNDKGKLIKAASD